MSEMKQQSVQSFLDQLAGNQATPGGGSAAALMGAQAAALVSMVCNLTIGKPKYAAVDADMRALLEKSESLRETLTGMIQADIDVFNKLMASYALPKVSDAEKADRSEKIQLALKEATFIAKECAQACAQALQLCVAAADHGNLGAISDAGVAVMAGYAGLKSAALNVQINAASLKDREYAEAQLAELTAIMKNSESIMLGVYQMVLNKL